MHSSSRGSVAKRGEAWRFVFWIYLLETGRSNHVLGEDAGTINYVITSEAWRFVFWIYLLETGRSNHVLGEDAGTITYVIARERSERGDLPFGVY